jgi:hypothetical protein
MAKLKTDWILFGVILAMTAFGLVVLYSASSVVAELRYKVEPYHFLVRQLMWAALAFPILMYFKRFDYRRLNSPAWGVLRPGGRAGTPGVGVLLRSQIPSLVQNSRTRIFAALRICEARPDSFPGVFRRAARARD